ncbi:hypothetical protein ATY41_03500 [Leifsonia xyli subsp. xyli]|uniref:Uncharacterized protein n=1 Tax=Leifsonia xyli subsp. xyli TaxID=59736 RepID=A0A1E2SIQ8_LEIXY|nr:hypothetical protein ATY41_03500 [Leifsonia xyli subsp. xyli]
MKSHLQSHGIALWACRNNEGAADFASFLKTHDRSVVFLVDQDSRTAAKHIFSDENMKARGFCPENDALYIGDQEFEDVFSDQEWTDVANRHWRRVDGENWQAAHIAELRSQKKFSDALLGLFKSGSYDGPAGKPVMSNRMALDLKENNADVPPKLVKIFERLVEKANY